MTTKISFCISAKAILSWPKDYVQPGKKAYTLVENCYKVKNKKTN